MKIRGLAVTTVAVALAFGAGACDPKSSTGSAAKSSASASPSAPDPGPGLLAAVAKDAQQTADVTLSLGTVKLTGSADPVKKVSQLNLDLGKLGGRMQIRQLGTDLYVQVPGMAGILIGATPGKWMHVDTASLPAASTLSQATATSDYATSLVKSVTSVKETTPGSYSGTLDLTKTPAANVSSVKALGDKAKAVPFTATTDSQGRVTDLLVLLSSLQVGAGTLELQFSNFGTPVSVSAPPAAQVAPMPQKFISAVSAAA